MDGVFGIVGLIALVILLVFLGAWAVMLLVPIAVAGAFTISFAQALAISLLAALLFRSGK